MSELLDTGTIESERGVMLTLSPEARRAADLEIRKMNFAGVRSLDDLAPYAEQACIMHARGPMPWDEFCAALDEEGVLKVAALLILSGWRIEPRGDQWHWVAA